MIDQKQIEKSNTEKKTKQEEIKETGYKDSFNSKIHSFNNKLTENMKINSQEHSFNDAKHFPTELINESHHVYRPPGMVSNTAFDEIAKGSNYHLKNDSFKSKKIEFFDRNEEQIEKLSKFQYFSLPKYGLEEKSCQTDLSGREIDCLKCISEEFNSLKEEFLLNFISNHPDILKKLYYNAIKKKDHSTFVDVKIKKRINNKTQDKKVFEQHKSKINDKKKILSSFFEEKSPEKDTQGIIKHVADDSQKRSSLDSCFVKVTNSSNIVNKINSNNNILNGLSPNLNKEEPSPISENFLNKKHLMETILDSMDKIKKEDVYPNSDSHSATQSISLPKKEIQQDKSLKKQISLEKKLSKIQKKQQFDPFKFFKEEYIHSHPNMDQSQVEQVKII